jgi:hypothetical protein
VWPFTRKTDASSADRQAAPVPQIRFDWKAVPPIQRLIADHPLTVPTEPFAADLVTHHDPRAIAQPLGHNVSLEAPRGLVLGIAHPGTRADGPEMVARPQPSRRSQLQRTVSEPDDPSPSTEEPDTETPLLSAGAPVASTIRQLPVTDAAPLQRSLVTAVGPENAPTPLASTTEVTPAASEPEAVAPDESLPAFPRLTLGQTRRLGLGAPLRRVPDTSVQRTDEHATPLPVAASPAPPSPAVEEAPYDPIFPLDFPTPKPVVAPAPISRLQRIPAELPLAHPPVSLDAPPPDEGTDVIGAPPQPLAEPEAVAPLSGSPTVSASADPRSTMLGEPAEGEREGANEAPLRPLPLADLPSPVHVQRATETLASPPEPSDSAITAPPVREEMPAAVLPAGSAMLISRSPEGSAREEPASSPIAPPNRTDPLGTAPLVFVRPLVGAAVQRAVETVFSSASGQFAGALASGFEGVRIPRDAATPMMATSLSARALSARDDFHLPLLASEPRAAGAQRHVDDTWRVQPSSDVQGQDGEAPIGEPSVGSAAELPLARIAAPSVQLSSTTLEARGPWARASMQRAPESDSGVAVVASGEQPPASEAVSSPAASSHSDDETRMDDLAGKLYDKIRNRLRNELLVDRERAGFLTDLR